MKKYLELVKFSHTIFAMPFALVGFGIGVLASGQQVDIKLLIYVVLCMVFARNAAMAFNRWLDQNIDAANPRTAQREIPSGQISSNSALFFIGINTALFILTTYFINNLCFYLSPIALLVILGYSYTKRFTSWCHFVLGLGLSLAPIGSFIAVTGYFHIVPILFSFGVLFWVAGFDIIYALQDEKFDKENNLYSMPSALGRKDALMVSRLIHIVSMVSFSVGVYYLNQFDWISILGNLGLIFFILLVLYQHRLVKPHDLSKINMAFFTTNGVASVAFGGLLLLDFFVV